MLPATVPFSDAAANAGRAALLPTALSTAPELLFAATEDRLHQQYRAPAMPRTAKLVASLRRSGVPAVVSGAGPTVLALVRSADAEAVAGQVPTGWTVRPMQVDAQGARVLPVE
jgi:homoserine kinase